MGQKPEPPVFRLTYLGAAPLSEDARALLTVWLERELKMAPGRVRLTHIPADYDLDINSRGEPANDGLLRLKEIRELLNRYHGLQMRIRLPGRADDRRLAVLQKFLDEGLSLSENSPRVQMEVNPEESSRLTVTLSHQEAPGQAGINFEPPA
jgi:hypothetical protein